MVVNTIFRLIVFIIVPDQNPVVVLNLILLSVDVREEASLRMTWQHFFIIPVVTIYIYPGSGLQPPPPNQITTTWLRICLL